MKIRKSTIRSTSAAKGSESAKKAEQGEMHARVEAVDQFERYDTNESKASEQELGANETEELLAILMEHPNVFRTIEWPALVGLDTLTPAMESALAGVLALVEPEANE